MFGFEIKAPEVATIIRWLLRVVLVVFLAWLVKGRQQEEPEEEDDDEAEASQKPRQMQTRGQNYNRGANDYNRGNLRQPPRRDPYAPRDTNVRQRRPVSSTSPEDFDAVINKMSKPKQMWQVQKGGEAPQIMKSADLAESAPKADNPKKESGENNQRRKSEEPTSLLKKSMLQGHTRPVTWLTWNRDGNLLFTCGKDKKVCVWSFPEGECLGNYEGHGGAVWACSVTADSRWLVSGGADQNVIVWEAGDSRELARVELPGVCRFVEWASTGGEQWSFATVHNKFGSNPPAITVFRFNGETIEQQLRIDKGLPGPSTQVRWGLADELLASAHENGELIFWRADTGVEVRRLKAHEAPISKIDFSVDRLLVATASTDMKIKVWDLGADGCDGTLIFEALTDRALNAVALGPLLTRAAATGPEEERPRHCSVIAAGGQDIRDVALTKGTENEFDTLLFRTGATSLEADGAAKGHFGPVHTVAFRSDGNAMASGSEDGCVRLHLFNSSALK